MSSSAGPDDTNPVPSFSSPTNQDSDPATNTDCPTVAPSIAQTVRAAEFQAFLR